jgi:hypothetical protein
MGAVTALRFLQQQGNSPLAQKVRYAIADAPFSSFKAIATEIVSRSTRLPEFISLVLADTFADKIKEQHGFELRDIDLSPLTTQVPVHFLYSPRDELMGEKHLSTILKAFKGSYECSNVQVMHNDDRPGWVLAAIMDKIEELLRKNTAPLLASTSKKRGLTITRLSDLKTSFPQNGNGTVPFAPRNADLTVKPIRLEFRERDKAQTVRPLKENRQFGKHSEVLSRP